jgi:ABC-type uncharacterized transport system ATPase component
LHPDNGEIVLAGRNVSKMNPSEISDQVFLVHQDPHLGTAPKLTLFENLMIADHMAEVNGTSKRQLALKYRDLLQPLGLDGRLKQMTQYLSGGERQLLALLIARLRPSSLLLLDEPVAALDPANANRCICEVRALSEQGKTILQVTHDVRMAVGLGHRTIVIQSGRIVYDESADKRDLCVITKHWHSTGDSARHAPTS